MQVRQLTPDVLRNVLDVCGDDVLLQHESGTLEAKRFYDADAFFLKVFGA